MTAPKRIQRRRVKGWRAPGGAVFVGRPTNWGNPWTVEGAIRNEFASTKAEARESASAAFRLWLLDGLGGQDRYSVGDKFYDRIWMLNHLAAIRGRDLMCWCPLDQPCHADVLLEIANGGPA